MPGRGTIDAIFAVQQLMERYGENQKNLHMVFIDQKRHMTGSQEKRFADA
jgi:hypothetical protein